MESTAQNVGKKTLCRLCAKENEKYFEIFGDKGVQIASIVSLHFWFELRESDDYLHICHKCWWRIESFHVYYLEIKKAQKFFESTDHWKSETQSMDVEFTVDDAEGIEREKDETNDCQQDDDSDVVNGRLDSGVSKLQHDQAITVQSTETVCKSGYEAESLSNDTNDTHASANKNRSKRKRDSPSVLADDDLIRNWCQMQCTKCSESFTGFTFKDVKIHYSKDHDMNGFLICCQKKFFRRVRALEHIARHINPKEFSCDKCNKNFSDKPALLNHLDGHVSPDQRAFKCNECDYSFVRRYQLSQHQKHRHFSEEKKFVCDTCSKSFITKSILQSHIRSVHSNNTTSMCDVCAKTFKSKQCLQQHLLQHRGEETTRVQCTICSAWLKHQNSLRGHMARHLDAESEHICTECGKRAPSRGALRSHQKYVHNNTQLFACTLCVKSFKKSLTLKEHIASCHTGEVLYHCPYCTKTFNSSANLCSHKKRMHQNNVESVA